VTAIAEAVESAKDRFRLPHSMRRILERGAVDYRFWCREWLDWNPHPGQLAWGSHRAKRAFYVTGARSGKSEGEAVRRLYRMFYRPNTRHLNASITMDQATIVLDKMDTIVQGTRLEPLFKALPAKNSFPRRGLVNGAECWFRSTQNDAKYIRGWSFHEINVDEASYEKAKVWTEVLTQRVMDYDGLLSGTTTPRGRNWVYYEGGRSRSIMRHQLERAVPVRRLEHFFRHGPSYENPYLPRRVWRRLQSLPDRAKKQEIEGLFVDLENSLFTEEEVSNFTNTQLNENGDLHEKEPNANAVYLLAWDLGRKRHKTTLLLGRVDVRPWRIFYARSMRGVDWNVQKRVVEDLQKKWRAHLYFDAQGVGDGVRPFLDVPANPVLTPGTKALEEHLHNLQRAGGSKPPMFEILFDPDLDYDVRHFTWDAPEEEDEDGEMHHWDYLKALAYFVHGARQTNPGSMPASAGGRSTSGLSGGGRSVSSAIKDW